ncbi:hypothetical protein Pmani_002714 [Petrolisthes manimaculis]|uniref:Uncharacterized protein n=1 Tax=Petrolisthes manimaculis TaxID=1843537 RepID=A0AAE1QJV2_9EUCA|nr:hypothetical protein Pmani_002714 [Petrolisthes manimaculis]
MYNSTPSSKPITCWSLDNIGKIQEKEEEEEEEERRRRKRQEKEEEEEERRRSKRQVKEEEETEEERRRSKRQEKEKEEEERKLTRVVEDFAQNTTAHGIGSMWRYRQRPLGALWTVVTTVMFILLLTYIITEIQQFNEIEVFSKVNK